MKQQKYVILLEGGIEPFLYGPYSSESYRNKKAKALRNADEENLALWLNIDVNGKPTIGSYSGGFMEG